MVFVAPVVFLVCQYVDMMSYVFLPTVLNGCKKVYFVYAGGGKTTFLQRQRQKEKADNYSRCRGECGSCLGALESVAGQAGLHSQMLAGKLDVSETASALIHENDPGKKKKKKEKSDIQWHRGNVKPGSGWGD